MTNTDLLLNIKIWFSANWPIHLSFHRGALRVIRMLSYDIAKKAVFLVNIRKHILLFKLRRLWWVYYSVDVNVNPGRVRKSYIRWSQIKGGNEGEAKWERAHKLHKLPLCASCEPTALFLIKSPSDESLRFSRSLKHKGRGRENPHKVNGYS